MVPAIGYGATTVRLVGDATTETGVAPCENLAAASSCSFRKARSRAGCACGWSRGRSPGWAPTAPRPRPRA